ncbi:MAG: Eco47II family restriction endonuclease [Cyclobacteriaceae bacterium]
MAYLSWIDDNQLVEAVLHLMRIAEASQKLAQKKFNNNVIDPFSAVFQIAGFGISYEEWVIGEQTRQSQKTLQNHIGNFHQIVLGNVDGWENLKTGNVMDLISNRHKILAEIKNKHNTVKGSDLSGLYKSMEGAVMPKSSRFKDYTSYYVTIIPKRPERFDRAFAPSDKETGSKLPENEKIRIIDGASFYGMVTGVDNALEQLFDVLPTVIKEAAGATLSEKEAKKLKSFFSLAYGSPV